MFCPSCQLRTPTGLAFDTAGNLFVVNTTSIVKVTTAGVGTRFAVFAFNNPNQMTIDSTNTLYIANTVRWGADGGKSEGWGSGGPGQSREQLGLIICCASAARFHFDSLATRDLSPCASTADPVCRAQATSSR